MTANSRTSWVGIGLFLFVMLGNACTIVLVRALSELASYSPFQLVFLTHSIGALLCVLLLLFSSKAPKPQPLPRRVWGLLLLRSCLEFTAFSASFYAISQLPLPMHTALIFMSPLFGTVLALLFLGERGSRVTYACLALGMAGMLLITRPASIEASLLAAASFSLLAAFGFASCSAIIKLLTRHISAGQIARHMLWMTSAVAAPFALAQWQPIDAAHWPQLAALGVLAFLLQHSVAMALARVPLMSVIPLNFLQLVIVSLLAWWLFAETIATTTAIGASIILTATLFNLWHARRGA